MVTYYYVWYKKHSSLNFLKIQPSKSTITKYISSINRYKDSLFQVINIRGTTLSVAILKDQK